MQSTNKLQFYRVRLYKWRTHIEFSTLNNLTDEKLIKTK